MKLLTKKKIRELEDVIKTIADFYSYCAACGHTDTGDAWDLLRQAKAVMENAIDHKEATTQVKPAQLRLPTNIDQVVALLVSRLTPDEFVTTQLILDETSIHEESRAFSKAAFLLKPEDFIEDALVRQAKLICAGRQDSKTICEFWRMAEHEWEHAAAGRSNPVSAFA